MSTETPACSARIARPAASAARRATACAALVAAAGLLAGCRQDMHDQPRYEPLEASAFFPDGMASRKPPEGTVARGQLREDPVLHTGLGADGSPVDALPMPADERLLRRGQQRFDIFCSPCHGRSGGGEGMVVRRGFKRPPSLHDPRLRAQPLGYFFDVTTNGFGVMPSYASQIAVEDRWAIAAYVRVLQLSQNASLAELSAEDRARLDALPAPTAPAPAPGTAPAPGEAGAAPGAADGAATDAGAAGTGDPAAGEQSQPAAEGAAAGH